MITEPMKDQGGGAVNDPVPGGDPKVPGSARLAEIKKKGAAKSAQVAKDDTFKAGNEELKALEANMYNLAKQGQCVIPIRQYACISVVKCSCRYW